MADKSLKLQSKAAVSISLQKIPEPSKTIANAPQVQFGIPIPPQQQLLIYSFDQWEDFIREWVHSQKNKYQSVQRLSGPNDMGIDVAGLADVKELQGVWDNYQCKHYDRALTPSDAAAEIAKMLWHSYRKHYASPRRYYFMAPCGCGTGLTKLLGSPSALKSHIITNWNSQCAKSITAKEVILLDGDFKAYVEAFDFSIFSSRSTMDVIDEHRSTPYFAIRFGGGLPNRPPVVAPPAQPDVKESRYVQKLFEAYSDHTKDAITSLVALGARQDLADHFHRQREFFYHAEALRNFARDTVPSGTFEDLQSEVHAGVVDVEAAPHQDGYARVNAVTQAATQLNLTSNALISVVKIQDRKGICHQLANDDRLCWRKT